jgi:hypothetical protein
LLTRPRGSFRSAQWSIERFRNFSNLHHDRTLQMILEPASSASEASKKNLHTRRPEAHHEKLWLREASKGCEKLREDFLKASRSFERPREALKRLASRSVSIPKLTLHLILRLFPCASPSVPPPLPTSPPYTPQPTHTHTHTHRVPTPSLAAMTAAILRERVSE